MSVQVVLLGPLRDLAAADELTFPAPLTWAALLGALPSALSQALQSERVRVACNGAVLADKTALVAHDGEEVALLPAVSGG